MFSNIFGLLVILVVAAAAFRLANKMRRKTRKIAKFSATGALGVIGLLAMLLLILATLGVITFHAPRGNDVLEVTVAGKPAQIARGAVIAETMCAACHTLEPHDLPLSGAENLLGVIPIPLGSASPPT